MLPHYNRNNSKFSPFNRVKRSSLVRPDDTVETVKCYAQYEQSTTKIGREENPICQRTVPIGARWEGN